MKQLLLYLASIVGLSLLSFPKVAAATGWTALSVLAWTSTFWAIVLIWPFDARKDTK